MLGATKRWPVGKERHSDQLTVPIDGSGERLSDEVGDRGRDWGGDNHSARASDRDGQMPGRGDNTFGRVGERHHDEYPTPSAVSACNKQRLLSAAPTI